MNYLNRALDILTLVLCHRYTYSVFFTTFTIIASVILFKEWGLLQAQDMCLETFVGFSQS